MNQYLKIESKGVCPKEGFTVLGVSLTRFDNNSKLIGKFGSGNKHACAVLLRHGLTPQIFCGTLGMEFFAKNQTVSSETQGSHDFQRVCVKYSGKEGNKARSSVEELGFVLEYGVQDWSEVDLALREFVSNAIDSSIKETGDWSTVMIEPVSENQIRAKAGYTRVFVPFTPEVEHFYENLNKWFLHFSEPELLEQSILPKRNRNMGESRSAVIYRNGVRVREIVANAIPSLFDYNLRDLELDESRQVDDWHVKHHAGRAVSTASSDILATYVMSLASPNEAWEHSFDQWSLRNNTYRPDVQEAWKNALVQSFGEQVVVTDSNLSEQVTRKGYRAVVMHTDLVETIRQYGGKTHHAILNSLNMQGFTEVDATNSAQFALDTVWNCVTSLNLAREKVKPSIKCFDKVTTNSTDLKGCYNDGTVYVNAAIAPIIEVAFNANDISLLSEDLLQTVIEEVAHHITGAADTSRPFLDYIFKMMASLMKISTITT